MADLFANAAGSPAKESRRNSECESRAPEKERAWFGDRFVNRDIV
jgi:hypothetical protein